MTRPNYTLARLCSLLKSSPAPKGITQRDAARILNVSQATISRNMKELMHYDPREAYICRWQRAKADGGPPICAYAYGDLPDVECDIETLSQAERTRRCRARKRPIPAMPDLMAHFYGRVK